MSTSLTAFLLFFYLIGLASAGSVSVELSPMNTRRPYIDPSQVNYIILHTTEGSFPGCYAKLKQKGEAHFLVRTTGQIIQLMDLNRLAKHAGRSSWKDKKAIDRYSIGIEVEGTHTIPPNLAQRASLRSLLNQLRRRFQIPANNVLTHSMVAYGSPNRFWHSDHRGRKRCGMTMQREDIRRDLGLAARAETDPNIMAEQLIIADEPLFAFLYNPHTTRDIFSENSPGRIPRFILDLNPPRSTLVGGFSGPQLPKPEAPAANTTKEKENEVEFLDADTVNGDASALVGNQMNSEKTIYFFQSGTIRTGKDLEFTRFPAHPRHLPKGTKILAGYIYGGKVSLYRSAYSIAKKNWNYPSTIYRWPDASIKNGDEVNPATIPIGTIILFQR
jgi:hypothetical protein